MDPASTAVLQHVEHGSYPDSQKLAASNLPASALPDLLKAINEARNNVEVKRTRPFRRHGV